LLCRECDGPFGLGPHERYGDDARVRSRSPTTGADLRFARPASDVATFEINGKHASVIWVGIRGSRRAWRTSAFCESARQDADAGWTLAALAFAQTEASTWGWRLQGSS
jgi:hypothetical protein